MRQEHNGSTPGPDHNVNAADIVASQDSSTPAAARDAVPNEGPSETVISASNANELDVEKHTKEPHGVTGAASDASDSDTDADTYPEGGPEAWTVTFGAWCAMGKSHLCLFFLLFFTKYNALDSTISTLPVIPYHTPPFPIPLTLSN